MQKRNRLLNLGWSEILAGGGMVIGVDLRYVSWKFVYIVRWLW